MPYLLAASLHLLLRFILITDPDQHQDPALFRRRFSKYLTVSTYWSIKFLYPIIIKLGFRVYYIVRW